jgi:hypothetical protein
VVHPGVEANSDRLAVSVCAHGCVGVGQHRHELTAQLVGPGGALVGVVHTLHQFDPGGVVQRRVVMDPQRGHVAR